MTSNDLERRNDRRRALSLWLAAHYLCCISRVFTVQWRRCGYLSEVFGRHELSGSMLLYLVLCLLACTSPWPACIFTADVDHHLFISEFPSELASASRNALSCPWAEDFIAGGTVSENDLLLDVTFPAGYNYKFYDVMVKVHRILGECRVPLWFRSIVPFVPFGRYLHWSRDVVIKPRSAKIGSFWVPRLRRGTSHILQVHFQIWLISEHVAKFALSSIWRFPRVAYLEKERTRVKYNDLPCMLMVGHN